MNVEYSLGPFSNWFLPSCLDIWSSADGNRVLCSYGARYMLCLLTITKTKTIKAIDCQNVFSNSKSIISCTQFAKKGSNAVKRPLLFIGSNDGEAAVMDCNSNDLIYQKVVFSDLDLPAKKILSADWSDINDNPIVYYSMHSVIICWNIKTKVINKLLIGDNYRNKIAISCITCSQCGAEKLAIGYMNGDITIIYLENMSSLNVEQTLSGHCDDICSLSFSWTKGQYLEGVLASVSRDGFVKVWDVVRKYNIADIKLDANKAKNKNWFSLAVLPNTGSNDKFEILIGSGNGELLSIEIPDKPPDSKIRIHKPMLFYKNRVLSHSSVVFSIAIDVRTMLAITSSLDHQILVWDLIERKAITSFSTFSHGLNDISVSPIDPLRVAIAIGDGFHIINFDNQLNVTNQRRFPVPFRSKDSKGSAIVWHPDYENRIAFGTSGGEIVVFDLNSSQKSSKYSSNNSLHDSTKIYGLGWGPSLEDNDESTLYCVHQSGRLYLHYISSNKVIEFTHYVEEEKKRSEIIWKTNYKHLGVGNENGSVDIFEYQSHKLDLKLRINVFRKAILCLRWNSIKDEETSNWLAVSSYSTDIHCYSLHNYLKSSDKLSQIESTASVPVVAKPDCVLKGHSDRISSMSWCPHDSNKLVSVSYDKMAHIWDVRNETCLVKFGGHKGLIYAVLWSAFDEDLIFSGGEDNYFHAWRPSKQSSKTLSNSNEKNYTKVNDYWPHLENGDQCDDETSVSNVLNDCINKVVLDGNCAENGELNGFSFEDKQKQQQKHKNKSTKKRSNKEYKKNSLFPLSNSIEKSSTKYQKIEDIEALFERVNGLVVSEERTDRILLYGNWNDIQKFVEKEVSHHMKQGNKEQKEIVGLFYDIKATVEESIEQNDTNPYLVALSMSVSRNLWKQSSNLLAQQLLESDAEIQTYRLYRIELSAIVLISQNRMKEAIDLLLSNHLFREALIVANVKLFSEETIEYIMTEWAKHRQNNHDFEGATKCLTAIRRFSEAADILDQRNDQQFDHTICLLRSLNK